MVLSTKAKQDDLESLIPVVFQCQLLQTDSYPVTSTNTTVIFTDVNITDPNVSLTTDKHQIRVLKGGYYRVTVKLCILYGNTGDNNLTINYYVDSVNVVDSLPYFPTIQHTCHSQVDEVVTLQDNSLLRLGLSTPMTNFNLATYNGVPQVTVTLVKLKDLN